MSPKDRRAFLKLCLQSMPALAIADRLGAQAKAHDAAQPVYRAPAQVDKYIDPLPILKPMVPTQTGKGATQYRVRMMEFKQQLHSQVAPTRLWGYEGHYPGPTFEALSGKPVEVVWENHLPTQHIFPIDPHIHGTMGNTPQVRTVPHLHGSRTSSLSDGLPEKWFTPGASAHYSYPNDQHGATLWYHDHAVGITRLNVYAGMSGFYLLRDQEELALGLPSGDYEIPIILHDKDLDDQGQLVYAPSFEDGVKLPGGIWGPEFFGDFPLVNGALFPYLNVEPRAYRLRILNGCNSRFVNLFFNTAKSPTDVPGIVAFHQIGSDGGLLPRPASLNRILMGPAERADLIIDFRGLEGKTVTLSNNGSAPFPGWDMMTMLHPPLYEWMQFKVTLPLSAGAKTFSIPQTVAASFTRLDSHAAVATRDFVLAERVDAQGKSLGVRINDKGYDEPITETVKLGTMEKWRFINTTDDAHPMHLHLVRQGYSVPAYVNNGTLQLVGAVRPPTASEAGWKDTAVVNPRDVLTILVKFEGYTGKYVYHCHMLEHEDNDMMRPFEVVA
jgi:spore coat protein A